MVYYVSDVTAAWEQAKRGYIDETREHPLRELPYAEPESLELSAPEREHIYTIGHGYRVVPDGAPKKAFWNARGKDYAITDMAAIDGYTLVSKKFRALVEFFEPNVHQFIPVDIYDKAKDGNLIGTWYWLNICNRIDAIDGEASGFEWVLDYSGVTGFWNEDADGARGRVFSLKKLAGHHLWVNPNLVVAKNFFVTSAFAEAGLSEGLTGVTFTEQREL